MEDQKEALFREWLQLQPTRELVAELRGMYRAAVQSVVTAGKSGRESVVAIDLAELAVLDRLLDRLRAPKPLEHQSEEDDFVDPVFRRGED